MRERPALRKLAPIAVLAAGLWLAGCASVEAENDGQPGVAGTVAAIAGQFIGGVIAGMAGAFGGQPQDAYAYSEPSYRTGSRTTSTYYVYQAPPARHHHHHSSGHRGHRRH